MNSFQSRLIPGRSRVFSTENVKTATIFAGMFLVSGLATICVIQDQQLKAMTPVVYSCQSLQVGSQP